MEPICLNLLKLQLKCIKYYCLVLSCLVLSFVVLSSCFFMYCLIYSCLVISCLVLLCLVFLALSWLLLWIRQNMRIWQGLSYRTHFVAKTSQKLSSSKWAKFSLLMVSGHSYRYIKAKSCKKIICDVWHVMCNMSHVTSHINQ